MQKKINQNSKKDIKTCSKTCNKTCNKVVKIKVLKILFAFAGLYSHGPIVNKQNANNQISNKSTLKNAKTPESKAFISTIQSKGSIKNQELNTKNQQHSDNDSTNTDSNVKNTQSFIKVSNDAKNSSRNAEYFKRHKTIFNKIISDGKQVYDISSIKSDIADQRPLLVRLKPAPHERWLDRSQRLALQAESDNLDAGKIKAAQRQTLVNKKPQPSKAAEKEEETLMDILVDFANYNSVVQAAKTDYMKALKQAQIAGFSLVTPDKVNFGHQKTSSNLKDLITSEYSAKGKHNIQKVWIAQITKTIQPGVGGLNLQAAWANVGATLARYEQTIIDTFIGNNSENSVLQAIVSLLQAQKTLEYYMKNLKRVEDAFISTQKRAEPKIGLASASELAYAQSEYESGKSDLFAAELSVKKAKATFIYLVGRKPRKNLQTLAKMFEDIDIAKLDPHRAPGVRFALDLYKAARARKFSSIASQISPSLTLSGDVNMGLNNSENEDNPFSNDTSITAGINFNIWNTELTTNIVTTLNDAQKALYEYKTAIRNMINTMQQKLLTVKSLQQQLVSMELAVQAGIRRSNSEESKFRLAYNEKGQEIISPIDMFTAYDNEIKYKQKLLEIQSQLWISIFSVKLTAGECFSVDSYGNVLPKDMSEKIRYPGLSDAANTLLDHEIKDDYISKKEQKKEEVKAKDYVVAIKNIETIKNTESINDEQDKDTMIDKADDKIENAKQSESKESKTVKQSENSESPPSHSTQAASDETKKSTDKNNTKTSILKQQSKQSIDKNIAQTADSINKETSTDDSDNIENIDIDNADSDEE